MEARLATQHLTDIRLADRIVGLSSTYTYTS